MSLINYIIKRLLYAVVMFVVVIIAVWILIGFIPGDPIETLLARFVGGYEPDEIEALRIELMADFGLDKPLFMQLLDFFFGIFTGDWGLSMAVDTYKVPVFELIMRYFPRTLELAIIPLIVVNILAAFLGKYTAVHRGKKSDSAIRGLSILLVSLPAFWVALLFQYAFRVIIPSITFGLIDLPVSGLFSSEYYAVPVPPVTGFRTIDTLLMNRVDMFLDTLMHLIVPSLVFIFVVFGHMMRPARSCMLDVIESDYIRTARAKGTPEKQVINKHAFRNALIPYSTFIGFNIGYFIAGAAYIEFIFGFHGLGAATVNAFLVTDYFMIRGLVVIFCLINIFVNLFVDVMYAILDPRISYG